MLVENVEGCRVVVLLDVIGRMVDVVELGAPVVLVDEPVVEDGVVEDGVVDVDVDVGIEVVVVEELEPVDEVVSLVGMNMVVDSVLNLFSSKLLVVGLVHSVVGFSENDSLVSPGLTVVVDDDDADDDAVVVVVVFVVDLKNGRFVTFLNFE